MPSSSFQRVREANAKFGQPTPTTPTEPTEEQRILRSKMLLEEVLETIESLGVSVYAEGEGGPLTTENTTLDATHDFNMIEALDGAGDVRVIAGGVFTDIGADDEAVQRVIEENNLGKLAEGHLSDGTDGHPKGKFIKPEGYPAPDIEQAVNEESFELPEDPEKRLYTLFFIDHDTQGSQLSAVVAASPKEAVEAVEDKSGNVDFIIGFDAGFEAYLSAFTDEELLSN